MGEKPGPKPIEINWEEFDQLCGLQCSLEEFAFFFKCSGDTIERRVRETFGMGFAEYFAIKRQHGKIALRRAMFQAAIKKHNPALLIFLSKQKHFLEYTDKIEVGTVDNKPIQLNYKLDDTPNKHTETE